MASIRMSSQTVRLSEARVISAQSPISALLPRPAVTITAEATIADAVATMETEGVSALLVEDGAGIITEQDITRAVGHDVPTRMTVERVATRHPVAVPASTPIMEACAVMLNARVRHLVVNHDDSQSIVSLSDIAAVLLQDRDPNLWLTSLRVAAEAPSELWLG